MKKFLSVLLVCATTMTLSACQTTNQPFSSQNEAPTHTTSNISTSIATANTVHDEVTTAETNVSSIEKTSTKSTSTSAKKQTTVKASNTQPKVTTTIKSNNTSKARTTKAHIHAYTKEVIAATCTEKGYTIYTCVCGNTYKDNYTNLIAHTFTDGKCTMCHALDYVNPSENLKYNTKYAYLDENKASIDILTFKEMTNIHGLSDSTLISYWYYTDNTISNHTIIYKGQTYHIGGVGGPYIYLEFSDTDIAIRWGSEDEPISMRLVVQHDGQLRVTEGQLKGALFTPDVAEHYISG